MRMPIFTVAWTPLKKTEFGRMSAGARFLLSALAPWSLLPADARIPPLATVDDDGMVVNQIRWEYGVERWRKVGMEMAAMNGDGRMWWTDEIDGQTLSAECWIKSIYNPLWPGMRSSQMKSDPHGGDTAELVWTDLSCHLQLPKLWTEFELISDLPETPCWLLLHRRVLIQISPPKACNK